MLPAWWANAANINGFCTTDQEYHSSFLITGLPLNTTVEVRLNATGSAQVYTHSIATGSNSNHWVLYSSLAPDINQEYNVEVMDNGTNILASACTLRFANTIQLSSTLCNGVGNYHNAPLTNLPSTLLGKYEAYRFHFFDPTGSTDMGYLEYTPGLASPLFYHSLSNHGSHPANLDINGSYTVKLAVKDLDGNWSNSFGPSCAFEFQQNTKLHASLCDQSVNYHASLRTNLVSNQGSAYKGFRFVYYDQTNPPPGGASIGYHESFTGQNFPWFSDPLIDHGSNPAHLSINGKYTVEVQLQDQNNNWSVAGPTCDFDFENRVKLRVHECDKTTLDYHAIVISDLHSSNVFRYNGIRFHFFEEDNGVAGDYAGYMDYVPGTAYPSYGDPLTVTNNCLAYLRINSTYIVKTQMKDKNDEYSDDLINVNECFVGFENKVKLHTNLCTNQNISCESQIATTLLSSQQGDYLGLRHHFYEILAGSTPEYVGYLQHTFGQTAPRFSDPLLGACEPFLETGKSYRVETRALDRYTSESESNSNNFCDPITITSCGVANNDRCRVETAFSLDQSQPYWCGSDIDVTLLTNLPAGASNPVYTCYWNGSSVASGNTFTMTGSGLIELTGTVTYTLNGETFNCQLDHHAQEILDGNVATSTQYKPNAYWTFGTNDNITVDGQTYTSSAAHEDLIREIPMEINPGFAPVPTASANGVVGDYMRVEETSSAQSSLVDRAQVSYPYGTTRKLSMEYMMKFDPNYLQGFIWGKIPGGYGPGISAYLRHNLFDLTAHVHRYDDCEVKRLSFGKRIMLTGINRLSWDYYADNDWHHFALTVDLDEGVLKMYIDGYSPKEFQVAFATRPDDFLELPPPFTNFWFGPQYLDQKFGDLDEIAIYEGQTLSPTMIQKHYQEAMAGDHYSFEDDLTFCSINHPDADVTGVYDIKDFAIGFDPTGGIPWDDDAAIDEPIKQILRAPAPRYFPDHDLKRNFPWWNYIFLGGVNSFANPSSSWPQHAAPINAELALHWNYYAVSGDVGIV
ncbi:MAG: hypothetical protein AAGB22_02890, partial [Bacteroidota bacterium]